jgi:hypothetical protein
MAGVPPPTCRSARAGRAENDNFHCRSIDADCMPSCRIRDWLPGPKPINMERHKKDT